MDQTPLQEAPLNLDNIQEDVVATIVGLVRKRAQQKGGQRAEREKRRLVRDSTLRSVALSNKRAASIWLPFLLRDVCLKWFNVPYFYRFLKKHQDLEDYGKFIKSIHIGDPLRRLTVEAVQAIGKEVSRLLQLSKINPSQHVAIKRATEYIFEQSHNLESLMVEDFKFIPDFVGGQTLVPHLFWSNSLKKLCLAYELDDQGKEYQTLSARNSVWILTFCPQLESCALSLTITPQDFKFLLEFSDMFNGISNVKHLALMFTFRSNSPTNRTWGSSKGGREFKNRQTEAIYHLLSITKGLNSLELFESVDPSIGTAESFVTTASLSSLYASFKTLQHLRLLAMGPDPNGNSDQLLSFKTLKSISVDTLSALTLVLLAEKNLSPLSSSVEVIAMPFYSIVDREGMESNFKEDILLVDLLKPKYLPALNTAIVPIKPISDSGDVYTGAAERPAWQMSRRALEKADIFKGGNVKLTPLNRHELDESIKLVS